MQWCCENLDDSAWDAWKMSEEDHGAIVLHTDEARVMYKLRWG